MDETTATILLGCRLAKDLEANLPNMTHQPEYLWRTCDEIIRVFGNVKDRLSMSYPQMGFGNVEVAEQGVAVTQEMEGMIQEWLRAQQGLVGGGQQQESGGVDLHGGIGQGNEMTLEMSGRIAEVGRWFREHAEVAQPVQVSGSGGAPSSSQTQRRRKEEANRKRVIVAAPRMGNTEIPPEDGYTWRKYGQKDILNSRFPRSYFKCTHQKLYNCPAKKQVQRLDDDPNMFEVIYRGNHMCHLTPTAPSIPPPPTTGLRQDIIQQATYIHPPPPSPSYVPTPPLTHWLSMDIVPASRHVTSSSGFGMQTAGGSGLTAVGSSGIGGRGGGVEPSTSRYVEDQPVAYMADAMFNSGSSSNNSMELIFSSMEDKRDSRDKKN